MWIHIVLSICSVVVAIYMFFSGDLLSGYMLATIGYCLASIAFNDSEITGLKMSIADLRRKSKLVTDKEPYTIIG